jgi:protein TonB
MLEDCLFASRPSARSRKPGTIAVSVLVHAALAVTLILVPLFQHQVLPHVPLFEALRPPAAPPGVKLVPLPTTRSSAPVSNAVVQPSALIAPRVIPSDIARIADQPVSSLPGFLPSDGRGGDTGLSGLVGPGDPFSPFRPIDALKPPPPPPPAAVETPAPKPDPPPSAPVRRSSEIVQSNLIHMVKPEYPRLAVITRVHGAVILEAVITREGIIDAKRLRVLQSASPFLTPAALEAVKQWRYRPTLLNGQPVEVMTTITVNFTLN